MARGFESKDVEFQQAEAERARTPRRALTAEERDAQTKKRTIELALSRARHDLAVAKPAPYRQMLEDTIQALEGQLEAQAVVEGLKGRCG